MNGIEDKLSNLKFWIEKSVGPSDDLDYILESLEEVRDAASGLAAENRKLKETLEKITPAIGVEVSDPEHFDCEVQGGGLDEVRAILEDLSKCTIKGTLTKVSKL